MCLAQTLQALSKPDHLIVFLASKTYFRPLLEAGVRIFLYARGFVHAKTVVIDSWMGTIGSANMDLRSFNLNFELNAFVYGKHFAEKLAAVFEVDLDHANEIQLDDLANPRSLKGAAQMGARLLSPLL